MWAWLAGIYIAFIFWALWMWVRYRLQLSEVREWLVSQRSDWAIVGKLDRSAWEINSGPGLPEGVAWLVIDTPDRSAHVCCISGDQKSIIRLREGTKLLDVRVAPSSYTPSADSDIVLDFTDSAELSTTLIGPYTRIFPMNLRWLERHTASIRGQMN